ncbi:MAG: magnesium/cobalt transporter CorA [Sediminibacterium sp.]
MLIKKYLSFLGIDALFGTQLPRQVIYANPIINAVRKDSDAVQIFAFHYNGTEIEKTTLENADECKRVKGHGRITWLNIDGLRKSDVEKVSNEFGVHQLLAEDILSINQRPKMDEVDGVLYCLLNMLFFNESTSSVELEQISIVLGKDFVISFQDDGKRDAFNPIREKLNFAQTKIRQRGADYLCYALLDMIVDNYFVVMEKLGERIEWLEGIVIRRSNTHTLARINQFRKELIVLKRNIAPVRELINGILRSETDLIEDRTTKYYKDVYDHIIQAYDLTENYRDMMVSMQDLHINNVNLKMNEVMKVMAIVTCLLAPATVIGGIFGMNFEMIPYIHNQYGFFIAVALMIVIPVWMLAGFKKKGWF